MHEHAIWDAWEKRALLCYKDLMYEVRMDGYQPNWMTSAQYTSLYDVWSLDASRRSGRWHRETTCRGVVAKGSASTLAGLVGENGRGICTIRVVFPTASAKVTVGRHAI
ncbi:hypothetical protein M9H77_13101 [Catharanthus roseus]|uniref:Uncharacterized protein n=1 Tax=Catharanthus roseus TaxID=4058 RepID=A0ACC0BJL6_CATRO|nr:hypothetical protein M9H77_13101 [Catharanthus roseus]